MEMKFTQNYSLKNTENKDPTFDAKLDPVKIKKISCNNFR